MRFTSSWPLDQPDAKSKMELGIETQLFVSSRYPVGFVTLHPLFISKQYADNIPILMEHLQIRCSEIFSLDIHVYDLAMSFFTAFPGKSRQMLVVKNFPVHPEVC